MSSIIAFIAFIAFIVCCTASSLKGKEHSRSKRSMLGFHTGITCYHPDVNVIGSYGRYGCFCGLGGSGRPVDETDMCCYHHDECYTHAEQFKPKQQGWFRYFVDWSCGKSLCSGYSNECVNGTVVCHTKDAPKYEKLLCECDRNASICFARQWHTFRPHLRNISRKLYCDSPNSSHADLDLSLPNQTIQKKIYIDDRGFLIPDLELLKKEEAKMKKNNTSSEFDIIKEVDPTKKIPTINGEDKSKNNKLENEDGLDIENNDFDVQESSGGRSRSIFTPTRIILCVVCAFVMYLLCFWKLSKKRIQNLGRKTKQETVEL